MGVGLSLVYLLDNLSDACVNLLVCLNFLGRVDEKYIHSVLHRNIVLLLSPTFSYAALEKIALHGSLEHLLGYRNHDSIGVRTSAGGIDEPQPGNIPVLALGKKLADGSLSAEPFLFGESVRSL